MVSSRGYTAFFDMQRASEAVLAGVYRDFVVPLQQLLQRLGTDAEQAKNLSQRLWDMMAQPMRRYHSPVHVLAMLGYAERAGVPLEDADLLATWFHDAICEPQAPPGDNEEATARWMEQTLPAAGLDEGLVAEAAHRVRVTARHTASDVPASCGLLMDLDLAGLSADPHVFARQSEAVRAEMAHLTDADYAQLHIAFFHTLLQRERIYRTEAFAPYEAAARQRLGEEIERLAGWLETA